MHVISAYCKILCTCSRSYFYHKSLNLAKIHREKINVKKYRPKIIGYQIVGY